MITWLLWISTAMAAPAVTPAKPEPRLVTKLAQLRSRVVGLEDGLVTSLRDQHDAKANLKKIQELLKLQREERELGRKRLGDLERTIGELQIRRGSLRERVMLHQQAIR